MTLTKSALLLVPLFASAQSVVDPADKELHFKIAKTVTQIWPVLPFKQGRIHYRIYRSEKKVLVSITSESHAESFLFSDSVQSPLLILKASIPTKVLTSDLLFNGISYHLASSWSGQSPIFD